MAVGRQVRVYAHQAVGVLRRRERRPGWLVYGQGRTGSTLLGELVGSHPQAHFGNEVLRGPVWRAGTYVEGLRAMHSDSCYGVHVKLNHLTDFQGVHDPSAWLRERSARGWQLVSLRRDDLLRHSLSGFTRLRLKESGRSQLREGEQPAPSAIHVDPEALLTNLGYRQFFYDVELRALEGLPHLSVLYERDLMDGSRWQSVADAVHTSLGLAPHPVSTSLRRINSGPLSEIVANYDDVARRLRGTPWERFLE